jgi:hypothetical protein
MPKPLSNGELRVVVQRTEREGDTVVVRARVIETPRIVDRRGRVFETHPDDFESPVVLLDRDLAKPVTAQRVTAVSAEEMEFRIFDAKEAPQLGTEFIVRGMWFDGTMEMLRTAAGWHRTIADGHWFCPLTWENWEAGDPIYVDDHGDEISVRGWEMYVRDDLMRLGDQKPEGRTVG